MLAAFQAIVRLSWSAASLAYYAAILCWLLGGLTFTFLLLAAESSFWFFSFALAALPVGVTMAILIATYIAYNRDMFRERGGADHFRGTGLFYRYGNEIHSSTIQIPVRAEWNVEETAAFADRLRELTVDRLRLRLPEQASLATEEIVDTEVRQGKRFVKIITSTGRGSRLVHFLHYDSFGNSIVAHFFTYVRGTWSDFDLFEFVATSPVTFWFWGIPWLRNRFSIILAMSHLDDRSYDAIELQTRYDTIAFLLLDETRRVLADEGVLTQEVERAIVATITAVQNISVTGSSNVTLGAISQAASAPAAAKAA